MTNRRRLPLHVHISVRFLILLMLVGGIMGGLGYTVNRDILKGTASAFSARVGRDVLRQFGNVVGPSEMATRLISQHAITRSSSLEQRLLHLDFMAGALGKTSDLTSLYIGYANGDFFQLRRLGDAAERAEFAAPENTVFVVQSVDHPGGKPRGRFIYFDAGMQTLRTDERSDYANSFDPRSRPWYVQAQAGHGQIITAPYTFFTTGKTGTTIARRAQRVNAVVGADIRLGTIQRALSEQKATPSTLVVLANASGQIVADDEQHRQNPGTPAKTTSRMTRLAETGDPVLAKIAELLPALDGNAASNVEITVADQLWHVALNPFQPEGSETLVLITAIPDRELMTSAYRLLRQAGLLMILVVALSIPLIWASARAVAKPLSRLAAEADAIRHFQFSQPIDVDSSIREVGELAQTMGGMKQAISRFLDLSLAIAAEDDFERLLPYLLGETIAAAGACAGVFYLVEDGRLSAAAGRMADGSDLPVVAPDSGSALLQRVLAARGAFALALDAADLAALKLAHSADQCVASHAIVVPLFNRQDVALGAMVLLCEGRVDEARLSFVDALSGSAAVSLETKELMRAQKRLFEALIQLIAGAIDAKSPYTGGHCARVPEIAKRLAQAACAESSGPFADFQLDADGWEALHIASWLHDCGKVTTPEYVVDKATKLETIYDRIHEIRMRFEVKKRDAQIACLEAIAAGAPESAARARLAEELARIDDDFAFVAACNEGGEAMTPQRLQRLQAIAQQTWRRTLDDRLGVSRDEAQRQARTPAPQLPVDEALLADKPEHRIARSAHHTIDEATRQALGIRMQVPEWLYDRGELHNLSIARGTLSEEERYVINEHSVQTLRMLSFLPYPRRLREVPEIAGGHHEKVDGSGYPRRLTGKGMSVLSRMMAIADIFEALTAGDRPYKRGKTFSEAIRIMEFMRDDRHIDAELFDLFIRSGVHLDYARQFLHREQIDVELRAAGA